MNYDHHTGKEEKVDLFMLLNMILEQNYFQFNNQFFKQDEGLTMGAPTSALLAETFIQYLEHTRSIRSSTNTKSLTIIDM
jgi:hypothetical protein